MKARAILILAFGVSLHAQNRTAGFDGFAGANPPNPDVDAPLVVGVGMSFDFQPANANGGYFVITNPMITDLGTTAVSNGTPYLGAAQGQGENALITFPNGTFSPVSIDLSKVFTTNDAIPLDGGSLANADSVSLVGTFAGGDTISMTVRLANAFQTFTFPAGWQNLASLKVTASSDTLSGPNVLLLYGMDNVVLNPVCGYSLSQNSLLGPNIPASGRSYGPPGGGGQINISTANQCAWSVSGLPPWITSAATSGTNSGNFNYTVAANAGAERTGTFKVMDKTFYVEQASAIPPSSTSTARFAHLASGGGWRFTLVEANLGTAPAWGRLTFQAESGGGFFFPWTFPQSSGQTATYPEALSILDRTLNPNAQMVMESTGPDNNPPIIGSANLSYASTDKISGFGIFSNPAAHWDAVVPSETRGAPFYVLPFDNTGKLATGVAVNANGGNVAVTIRDDTGAQIGTDTIALANNGHISFMLNDKYPITAGKRGTIRFDRPSGGVVAVLGLRANGSALTSLPMLGNVGTTGGSITHATYNGGFTSIFYVVNTGTTSAPFTLSFYKESDGSALSVPLSLPQTGTNTTTSALTQTLAPGAMLLVQTVAQDAAATISGSAVLSTTGNISAFEIFQWTTVGQEASVPLETRAPASFVLIFDDTNGLTTGVALQLVSTAAASVHVIAYDDAGTMIGTDDIALSGHGHTSFLLPVKYSFAANKRGMLEFVVPSGAQISAVGLRAKPDGTLTTIPVLTK